MCLACSERERADLIASRLFELFDEDGNGLCGVWCHCEWLSLHAHTHVHPSADFSELIAGLSVLCGDPEDEKFAHTFRIIDTDGDGYSECSLALGTLVLSQLSH